MLEYYQDIQLLTRDTDNPVHHIFSSSSLTFVIASLLLFRPSQPSLTGDILQTATRCGFNFFMHLSTVSFIAASCPNKPLSIEFCPACSTKFSLLAQEEYVSTTFPISLIVAEEFECIAVCCETSC